MIHPVVLQSGLDASDPLQLVAGLVGLGFVAGTAAGLVALAYRWYVRERVPTGLPVLFGLTVVAVYLGTVGALGAVINPELGEEAVLASSRILPNLAAFAVGAAGSLVGIRAGDAVGSDLFAATGGRNVDRDVSDIVQSVGRVTSVRLPSDIDDIVGYDPMPDATKEQLADRRFLFPKRLRKTELQERLVARLKTDYGVGHVDLELADDGTVEYLAVGSRAAGIGPTLPPTTNAVAVRADPAHAASAGDLVQVWERDPLRRVLTGELRGVAGDIVTVAIDASDTPKLDPTTEYKLVTLPVQDRPDREFASLLRAASETMGTVTVTAGSELAGTAVGDLSVSVAAITREDEPPEPIPTRDRVLAAGDVIYAIARPEALRQTEALTNRQRPGDATPDDDSGKPGGDTEPTADATDPAPTTEIPDAEASDTGAATVANEPTDGDPETGGDEAKTDEASDDEAIAEQSPVPEAADNDVPVADEEPADAEPSAAGEASADEWSETPDTDTDGDAEADAEADWSAEAEADGETATETNEDEPMQVWDPDERLEPVEEPEEESDTATDDDSGDEDGDQEAHADQDADADRDGDDGNGETRSSEP